MNGAQVIAEILKREGTEFLSCYPRNPVIEPCAALDIRPILCRQERVGVGLADGYSRIRRGKRNGVFAAQAGPGIANFGRAGFDCGRVQRTFVRAARARTVPRGAGLLPE